jgi:hypothetical protein
MSMRRLAPLLLPAALFGCGAGAARATTPAAPVARAAPEQKREEPLKLIAPPPAYGNKIVMAARGR